MSANSIANVSELPIETVYIHDATGRPSVVTGLGHNVDHLMTQVMAMHTGGDRIGRPKTKAKDSPDFGTELVSRMRQLLVIGCTGSQINSVLLREGYLDPGEVVSAYTLSRNRQSPDVQNAIILWKNMTLVSGFAVRDRQLEALNRMAEDNLMQLYPDDYPHLQSGFLPPAPLRKLGDRLEVQKRVIEIFRAINDIMDGDNAPRPEAMQETTKPIGDGQNAIDGKVTITGGATSGQMLEGMRNAFRMLAAEHPVLLAKESTGELEGETSRDAEILAEGKTGE